MSRILLIAAVAALACGCGDGAAPRTSDASQSGAASGASGTPASANAGETASDRSVPATSAPPPDQLVTVIGCLGGGEAIAAPPAAGATPGSATAASGGNADGTGANLFMLTNAKPDAGGGGVGANGAGASGGPLISGVAEYRLEGDATELRSHLNQQVRISARLDPRQTMTSPVRPGTATADSAANNAGNAAGRQDRASGSNPNDNARGAGAAPNTGATARVLVVESVQTVAPSCTTS